MSSAAPTKKLLHTNTLPAGVQLVSGRDYRAEYFLKRPSRKGN